MELHQLLQKTEEEIKKLPLIDQLTYWQWKYEEVWQKLNVIIEENPPRNVEKNKRTTENQQ